MFGKNFVVQVLKRHREKQKRRVMKMTRMMEEMQQIMSVDDDDDITKIPRTSASPSDNKDDTIKSSIPERSWGLHESDSFSNNKDDVMKVNFLERSCTPREASGGGSVRMEQIMMEGTVIDRAIKRMIIQSMKHWKEMEKSQAKKYEWEQQAEILLSNNKRKKPRITDEDIRTSFYQDFLNDDNDYDIVGEGNPEKRMEHALRRAIEKKTLNNANPIEKVIYYIKKWVLDYVYDVLVDDKKQEADEEPRGGLSLSPPQEIESPSIEGVEDVTAAGGGGGGDDDNNNSSPQELSLSGRMQLSSTLRSTASTVEVVVDSDVFSFHPSQVLGIEFVE
jgi:hypothetical protein